VLAGENWPVVTGFWEQQVDAELNRQLYLSPLCDEIDFPNREREMSYLASRDMGIPAIVTALDRAKDTITTPLSHATTRVRHFIEDTALEPLPEAPETKTAEALPLHGLVYILLDSGHIPVGSPLEPVELSPLQGIFLKSLAVGNTLEASAELIRIDNSTRKKRFQPRLEALMGVDTPQGLIGNSFRMEFFVPSTLTKPFNTPMILKTTSEGGET